MSTFFSSRLASLPAFPVLTTVGLSVGIILAARQLFSSMPRGKTSLQGKVVLITGGSRGLGLAMAEDFGAQGARLALCARDEGELKDACQILAGKGIDAVPFAADVTDRGGAEGLLQNVLHHFGRIDVLVNNAGIIKVGPFESFEQKDYEDAMNLMFWAPVHLSLAALPHMEAAGGGHIVNIASVGGQVSIPHLLPYSCAKFALVGFSNGLSAEVKSKHVHVLTVSPGLMRTGSHMNAEFSGDAEHEFAWFGVLGNLPGFSVGADYAAKQIRRAIEQQQFDCIISLPAKILVALEGVLPEVMRNIMAVSSRLLPAGDGNSSAPGKSLSPNTDKIFRLLTTLGRHAAQRLNEKPA